MIKINQIQGWFTPYTNVFTKPKKIKKIGIQTDYLKTKVYINKNEYTIGRTNKIQFDDLDEEINLYFTGTDKIFAIIDYEERID